MDSDRRNRVAALLATSDHLPAAVAHELLAAHDAAMKELDRGQGALLDVKTAVILAEARAQLHKADADRLAAWIIRHPFPGPDMTEVLDLHDRL